MEEYNLLNQLMQVGQPTPVGYGVLAPQAVPTVEVQRKTKQPMQPQLAEPVMAAFAPRPKFPTSLDEFNSLIKRQTEGLAGQREGLKQIESQIADLQKPQESKMLAPILMAASDLVSGTQFMKGYQTPEQKEQARKAQALGLQMQMQKAKGDLTDKEIDLFKAQYQDALGRERLAQEENLLKMRLGAEVGKRDLTTDRDILKTKESQKIQAQINLKNAIDEYQTLLEEKGYQFKGEDADKLESTYADLKIKYKEAANLGALTGPDVGLLMEAIKPSTGIRGGAREFGSNIGLSGGVSGAQQGINQVKKLLSDDYGVTIDALESAYGKSPVIDQYRQKFTATKKTKTPTADGETKEWNGKTYKKQGDRWLEVK